MSTVKSPSYQHAHSKDLNNPKHTSSLEETVKACFKPTHGDEGVDALSQWTNNQMLGAKHAFVLQGIFQWASLQADECQTTLPRNPLLFQHSYCLHRAACKTCQRTPWKLLLQGLHCLELLRINSRQWGGCMKDPFLRKGRHEQGDKFLKGDQVSVCHSRFLRDLLMALEECSLCCPCEPPYGSRVDQNTIPRTDPERLWSSHSHEAPNHIVSHLGSSKPDTLSSSSFQTPSAIIRLRLCSKS